jgi:hypothetical protein
LLYYIDINIRRDAERGKLEVIESYQLPEILSGKFLKETFV